MPTKDRRVDSYIARVPGFARPILAHLRRLVHAACPEVEETLKWGFPHFMHKGILCSMAAFKQHCSFGFWKHALLFPAESTPAAQHAETGAPGMGQFGRITALSDLPGDKSLLAIISKAAALNDAGIQHPFRVVPKHERKLVVPVYLAAALKKNPRARAAFDGFSYSHRKEYVEWLTEARTEPTRDKRLATTLAWLTEGKSRNWKYERC
ncbi:MAG TPA: YdeI/OmpD-associated family protein [Candidatus Acidoferrum sp.]|jgi:hypothetical protein|nr:YdeI/OmpD-associated family protein [Candidatus Acidoferrum sp.]